jgi:uracil-DNA glycosylase family 4
VTRAAAARAAARSWNSINEQIVACRACPRLVEHCQTIAATKRAADHEWEYWGRPAPNFGDPAARLLVVGLAPGAHGANRTGRLFTGDSSGDWLFRALHRAGFANQPHSTDRNDGLRLIDCAITGVGHCAPPDNKPTSEEIKNCRRWLEATMDASSAKAFVALGGLAWVQFVAQARRKDWFEGKTPKFAHLHIVQLAGGRWLLGSYHPSRQNTNTGRLTERMLDAVFSEARHLLSQDGGVTRRPTQSAKVRQ